MHYRAKHDPHNGLLHFKSSAPLSGYWRYFPSAEFAPYVEHYWTIEWDLPQPCLRETLPYPSAHIVLEPGIAQLAGVHTKKFSRLLEGRSRVLGVKFRPGGLRPFVDRAVSAFTDQVLELAQAFGEDAAQLSDAALAHKDHHAAIAVVETFLRDLAPQADESAHLAGRIAERIARDREIRRVEQLAEEFAVSTRTLQRLFGEYIGVSPKWTIRRFRLQEAAERMAAAAAIDWPQTALDLGYADQAHFIRDFRNLVGKSPADYFDAMSEMPRT
jgi:AraC-like DNA-binding protein